MIKARLRPQVRNGIEVLRLSAAGYTDGQISAKLFLSPSTIRTRMKKFYGVVRAQNRHHALAVALINGWITLGDLADATSNLRPKKTNGISADVRPGNHGDSGELAEPGASEDTNEVGSDTDTDGSGPAAL